MLYLANRPHVSDIGYKRAEVADLSQSLFYLMVSLPDSQYKWPILVILDIKIRCGSDW